MTQQQIQQFFQLRYNQNNWKQFLGEIFTNARLLATPEELTGINTDVAIQALRLGYITINEDGIERNIAVYDVTLAEGIVLERNRVGLRNLLRKYWKDIDAAFIVYHRPENHNWRFTYVSELTGFDAEGELIKIKTEPKRYTYILGEGESCRTATERFAIIAKKGSVATLDDVKDAFSVEKLSKAFFEEYKEHYENFVEFLTGKRLIKSGSKWKEKQTGKPNPQLAYIFNGDEKEARDFNKKLLGRIVFLYFIQKKGWMGVPEKSNWGQGDPNFLWNLFDNCNNKGIFYSEYLSKLFFDTLNTQRKDDLIELISGEKIRIPFLNGGLFEEDNKKYRNLIFPAELFENLFQFFNQYNFTIYEDDPNDHTVAVDPEMLGHIFENLLEDNKDKGAYYTPKEIVHYMCQESLIEYLTTWFENKGYEVTGYIGLDKPDQPQLFSPNEGRKGQAVLEIPTQTKTNQIDRLLIEKLLKKKLDDTDKELILKHSEEFHTALDKVKICDPAIGSGAFPMGLLKEIFTAKQTLYTFKHGNTEGFNASSVKLNIIQNSIYGVDIEKGAVDIARLRFWLSLVVDENEPKALPNLDYKIVVGNSLVSKLDNDVIDIDWKIKEGTQSNLFGQELEKQKSDLLKKISNEQKEFFNPDSDKKKLAADIRNLKIDLLINQLELMVKTQGNEIKPTGNGKAIAKQTERYLETLGWKQQIEKLKKLKTKQEKPLEFFDWKLDFPEILNPILVNENGGFDIVIGNPPYVRQERLGQKYKEILKELFPKIANGTADLYVYFYGIGLNILKRKGTLIYITLNKYLKTKYGLELRNLLSKEYDVDIIIDFFELPVFEASTDTSITKILNTKNEKETKYFPVETLEKLNLFELTSNSYQKVIKDTNEWKFIDKSQESVLNKIYKDTISLKDFVNDKIYSGIKTAYNKAFVISDKVAESLLQTESKDIVKKYAKSTDIKQWELLNEKRFFLATGYDLDVKNEYPSAYKYLVQHEKPLIKRQDQGEKWWNLRACNYYNEFEKEKIIYMHTAKNHEFYLDTEGRYINNSCYMIVSGNKYLFCFLNSKLFKWFKQIKFVAYGDAKAKGRAKLDYNKMVTVPIKNITKEKQKPFEDIVKNIKELKAKGKNTVTLVQEIDNMVYKLYQLTYEEVKLIDPEFSLTEQEYEAIKV